MSISDDICSAAFSKERRMEWSRAFIKAWLADRKMQSGSPCNIDSIATFANGWIRESAGFRQSHPIVSSEDISEAALEVLGSEETVAIREHLRSVDRLNSIVPWCPCCITQIHEIRKL